MKIPNLLWGNVARYTVEMHCILTALALGMWIVIHRPISSGAASVRGLHLMDELFRFLPFKSDYAWGPLLFLPAIFQLCLVIAERQRFRAKLASVQAGTFSFIAILLARVNIGTTGVPTYTMLAVANLFVMVQLVQSKYGVNE